MNRYDPDDPGVFVPRSEMGDTSTDRGITTVDKPRADGLRYFVRVGGGYRGYKHKRNASAYKNS